MNIITLTTSLEFTLLNERKKKPQQMETNALFADNMQNIMLCHVWMVM